MELGLGRVGNRVIWSELVVGVWVEVLENLGRISFRVTDRNRVGIIRVELGLGLGRNRDCIRVGKNYSWS